MSVKQIGDRVQWTHVSQRGRTMSMAVREGVIEAIDGALAIVRTGKNRQVQVSLARLRAMGKPTQLDEFMGAIREVNRVDADHI